MSPKPYALLPVSEILDDIRSALRRGHELVVQAPPGAGKTTGIPLALLQESWLAGRKIVMLEPRRMAARAAANRMAQMLGEPVGKTVGYSIRLENCTSAATRIEVVTEGVLTRRLQNDPGLEDVALVIFDEFHERSLDADLCLALCLQARETFRESGPLKLLVMSATLDGEVVADLLGGAPVLTSRGRQYPVEEVFLGPHGLQDPIAPVVVSAVRRALREQAGSVLVFLPGQREINQVRRELAGALPPGVALRPLYGALRLEKQQEAIEAAPFGQRKVVLSTNVAETSLTIDGVSVVIDSGLAREALFDVGTGVTRLVTRRVSRASAAQRQGRAGRQRPGCCYRLWSREQDRQLVMQSEAEILNADLAPLVLQLLAWGVSDPTELRWLDLPPEAAWQQALGLLEQLGAVATDEDGRSRLTTHGVRLAQVPVHPRLAHMLLVGSDIHAGDSACLLAAVLSERNPLADSGADIAEILAVLRGNRDYPDGAQGWLHRTKEQSRRFARIAVSVHQARDDAPPVAKADVLGALLATAYPDRIARRREGSTNTYLLSNGRSGELSENDPLAREEWLAVADIGGVAGSRSDRIYSATALNPECFKGLLAPLVSEESTAEWDAQRERFVAERRRKVGAIPLASETLSDVSEDTRAAVLLDLVRERGLKVLPWTDALRQWQRRVRLLRESHDGAGENPWPDLSDEALLADLETWLGPWLGQVRALEDFRKLDLKSILKTHLHWPLPLELERLVPECLCLPSGNNAAIDYTQSPPVLAVKLQEMFGCDETPTVADGRVKLSVHLLSPAGRPLQVTADLASFWEKGYPEVRREMRGRYPKHPWPEDPLQAKATRKTKRQMGMA